MAEIRVGVVGYCPPSRFDIEQARAYIEEAFDQVEARYSCLDIVIVSGLCDVGVPAIAYAEAKRRGWRTVGFTSEQALTSGYPLFPVDEQIIVGKKWGDESLVFVAYVGMLVRVGGGPQSHDEADRVKRSGRLVWAYNLPRLDD